jgi:hypothetical protein
MLGSKANWVEPQVRGRSSRPPAGGTNVPRRTTRHARYVALQVGPTDEQYEEYPELGIEEWHKKHAVYVSGKTK